MKRPLQFLRSNFLPILGGLRFTLLAAVMSVFVCQPSAAQRHEVLSPDVASLTVVAGTDWLSLPVTQLGGEPVNIDFDVLNHELHRYTYKIEHCEADWTVSTQLLTSDFVKGFAEGNTIEDAEKSLNTNELYTHYHLQLPNSKCAFTMSGNYRLTVYDEDDDNAPVLTACFMVVEPAASVGLRILTNTDADINGRHQQVAMEVGYGALRVTNPEEQIHTVVLQNGRWDNARRDAKPQYVMADGLRWNHCRDYIFDGGNEYRKFEMLDVDHTTMGLESLEWDGRNYNAYVWTDEPRPNYVYDNDANGAFFIRNSDNSEIDYTCEYLLTHFRLKTPERLNGRVFLNAKWTYDRFLPAFEMIYNEVSRCYEATVKLKQGYYSYQYLLVDEDGNARPVPSEGNFYQTENTYQALVYYRELGGRTDRLVGYARAEYK